MACALPGCERTEAVNGDKLRSCSGGCFGLSRYCCDEHQKAHWKQHRAFCKRQAQQAETALGALQHMVAECGQQDIAEGFEVLSMQRALGKAAKKAKKKRGQAPPVDVD